MKTILQAQGVQKTFGTKESTFSVLKDIEMKIEEGDFIGIMGPSGSGKTTLLNILSTIDSPTSGDVMIAGQHINDMKEAQIADFRRHQLGFIFQDYNLLDTLTVKENILLPLALSKVNTIEIETRVEKIAAAFGITELLNKYPYQLSGGQKQRTAASRAMITNPSLIFADEPTGALDSKSAANLLESLAMQNQENKATILMVTHDAFAASFCKRILFIKDGQIVNEIYRLQQSREEFFKQILEVLAATGGVH